MNHIARHGTLLSLVGVLLAFALVAPAHAQYSIRVRSLSSTPPAGADSLVVVVIRETTDAGQVVASGVIRGNVSPGANNEYTVPLTYNSFYVPNRAYNIEAFIGSDQTDRSTFYGRTTTSVTIGPGVTLPTITTIRQEVRIPDVSSGLVLLAIGLLLIVAAGGLLLWRHRRVRGPALRPA